MAKRQGLTINNFSAIKSEGIEIPGTMKVWAGAVPPNGWLEMNGQAITSTNYPVLFSIYGANLPNLAGSTVVGAGTYTDSNIVQGLYSVTRALNTTGGAEQHVIDPTTEGINSPAHSHGLSTLSLQAGGDHQHNVAKSYLVTDPTPTITPTHGSFGYGAIREGFPGDAYYYFNGDSSLTYPDMGATTENGSHSHLITGNVAQAAEITPTSHNNMQPYIVLKWIVKA